jgi:putative ABC transport system permease protein
VRIPDALSSPPVAYVCHRPGVSMLDIVFRDVRQAVRSLLHARGFATTALVMLTVGIGANAAVFSVLKSVLLDALPYHDTDRLIRIYGRRLDGTQERSGLSAGAALDIRTRQSSFEGLTVFVDAKDDAVWAASDGGHLVSVQWVESNFFDVLGVTPASGRVFRAAESASGLVPLSAGQIGADTASAIVISHGTAERLFGSATGAVGRMLTLNGVPRTIVGALPADFISPAGAPDFYLPFEIQSVVDNPATGRSAVWLAMVGRLKSTETVQHAAGTVADIGLALAREYPQNDGGRGVTAMPLRDAMIGDTRTPVLVLMSSAVLVLLIACANLGGALLSRMLSRRTEFAVRAALGGSRHQITRQLLTETTVLSVVGGVGGLALAMALLALLRGVRVSGLPAYVHLELDGAVVLFAAAVAIATSVAFGLMPALAVTRWNVQPALASSPRGATSTRRSARLRGMLVAGQIALCMSLLMGAGLLGRSLWAMLQAPLGFDPDSVIAATIQLPPRNYPTAEARTRMWAAIRDRLAALPEVQNVASSTAAPTLLRQRLGVLIPGRQPDASAPFALAALVSDDYFNTLRIPVKQGRAFDARDRLDSVPVAVVSESTARRFWPDGDAIGAHLRLGANPNGRLIEVVGIVGDIRNDRARVEPEPTIYRPDNQIPAAPFRTFLLRTNTDVASIAPTIGRELRDVDAALPVQRLARLTDIAGEGIAPRRLPVALLAGFASIALFLAAVGVYAMFATLVAAREREFGLRMALGSPRSHVVGLIVWQGMVWMVVGVGVGAIGMNTIARAIRGLLYGVPPYDPVTIVATITLVIGCAFAALLIPSYRAASVDPAITLRSE